MQIEHGENSDIIFHIYIWNVSFQTNTSCGQNCLQLIEVYEG